MQFELGTAAIWSEILRGLRNYHLCNTSQQIVFHLFCNTWAQEVQSGPLFSFFFLVCAKNQTIKMVKVLPLLLLQQHTTPGPTRWRIFTDSLLLLLEAAAAAADGFVFQLPKFCLKLENVKQRISRNKTD